MGRVVRFAIVVFLAGLLTALSAVLVAPQLGTVLTANHSTLGDDITLRRLSTRSVVLGADGSVLAVLHRDENRAPIPLTDVPDVVVDTVLAVEDEDFWHHDGLNVRAAARALFTNVSAGDVRQGGSTITQQLVKNAVLSPDRDIERKLQEAVLALRLENEMSKDEILERYLNTVYLGNGAYGVQAAAELYFGVNAKDLDQAQAAFLAGLIRNPQGYDPFVDPEAAFERRSQVVDRLVAIDQIDDATADLIRITPIPDHKNEMLPKPKDYFVEDVKQSLLRDERLGATREERYDAVFRGGLTIKTTLNPHLQRLATEAVTSTLPDTGGQFTAAIVSVEPGSGAVRAMVGGPGFETAKYNITTQGIGRQPGSSFKPFVLAAAVENGISTRSTINGGSPCRLPNPGGTPDPYEVENYEGSRGGVMDLRQATQRSMNCAYARLALITGLDKVAATAAAMGITTELPQVPSMALGSLETRPIDMAAGYATLASEGVYHPPYLIEEVLDAEGRTLFTGRPEPRPAISAATARTVTDVLRGVVTGGTGTRARFPDGRPAAGKTGTTQEYGDAWFVGYVPQLSTAVWMGSPEGNTVKMRNVGGIRVTGGSYPARIWQAYMGPAMEGLPHAQFASPPPAGRGEYLRLPGERDERTRRTTSTTPRRRSTPRRSTDTTAPAAPPTTSAPDPSPDSGDGGGGGGGETDSGSADSADGAESAGAPTGSSP